MSDEASKDRKTADDEDEIDPDAAPDPQPFRAPKGLLKGGNGPGPVEVRSGAATGAPPPASPAPPPGADVRVDRPPERPKPPLDHPADGRIDVRFPVPTGPKPNVPRPEDLGPVDVQQQRGAAKLPRIEPPGEFEVVRPEATPRPRPTDDPHPALLGDDVEVVDYRKGGPIDVSEEAPDPFGTRRRIGVVDTTFARVDMGRAVEDELAKQGGDLTVVRRTVPGVKDLAVAAKILVEKHGCEVVVACGMVGGAPIDQQCAHEASLAIQWAQLLTSHHVLEVFVHQNEAKDEAQLAWLMDRRAREHAQNAWSLVFDPKRLRALAGTGQRQGFPDEGPLSTPPA